MVSEIFPPNATRDSLYGNTEIFNEITNIFPRFKLTGLDPALSYNLTFYASRTGVGDNRSKLYTVEGATTATATLNVANNISNVVTVAAFAPDALGEITIGLTPAPANNNGNHFTYLGVLKVQPAQVVLEFLAPVLIDGQLTLDWTGTGQLEWAPTITGPWTAITPTPSAPYSEAVVPNENRFYRINAGP
jgi:hypothetical protein